MSRKTVVQSARPSEDVSKILVAYFSRSGHTRELAAQIHGAIGGSVFKIVPAISYPSDYDETVKQAKQEQDSDYRPPLAAKVDTFESYAVIVVGSPIWWSSIASPIKTFLSEYDWTGKTVVPFSTHGGDRPGQSVKDFTELCPQSTILKGFTAEGEKVKNSQTGASNWLREIGMIR